MEVVKRMIFDAVRVRLGQVNARVFFVTGELMEVMSGNRTCVSEAVLRVGGWDSRNVWYGRQGPRP